MRKIACLLAAFGFAFAFFTLRAFGIDLLIDAVGFVLAANAMRAFRRFWGGFPGAAALCFALAALAVAGIFVFGTAFSTVVVLRAVGECFLFGIMAAGFLHMELPPKQRVWRVLLAAACFACAAAVVSPAVWQLLLSSAATNAFAAFSAAAHALLVAVLAVFAFVPEPPPA